MAGVSFSVLIWTNKDFCAIIFILLIDRQLRKPAGTVVLIPAYNAAPYLPSLIPRLLNHCQARDVMIIDDGSADGTATAAAACGIGVVSLPQNLGKGAALQRGFSRAILQGYDAVITLDADCQHPPELIPELIRCAARGGYDAVIASRRRQFGAMRPERALSNRLTTLMVSLLAGIRFEDSQCGFRLIRTALLRRLSLTSGGFQTESELLIQAGRLGAKIGQIDCPVVRSETSHIGHVRDTLRFVAMCMRYL
jgi:glycosyltransferase involved in cell wall biosynthesis